GLWARDYQEVDIFNWQQEVADMLSVPDVERELGVAEGRVRREVERLKPDYVLPLGERKYAYFRRNRLEEIRVAIGAPELEDHTLRERFFQFLADTDMTMSYKPVMLLALLEAIDAEGRAKLSEVVDGFRRFYQARRVAGAVVERPGARQKPV